MTDHPLSDILHQYGDLVRRVNLSRWSVAAG
jgi:hypothetical protein